MYWNNVFVYKKKYSYKKLAVVFFSYELMAACTLGFKLFSWAAFHVCTRQLYIHIEQNSGLVIFNY